VNVSVNIYIQAFVAEYLSGRNASQNRIGRLMLREDGSGAIEYYYGKMGEVLKTVRTLIVPNQAQVDHVRGYKPYGYDYVNKIGYDKFEQRTYLKYCNGAETPKSNFSYFRVARKRFKRDDKRKPRKY